MGSYNVKCIIAVVDITMDVHNQIASYYILQLKEQVDILISKNQALHMGIFIHWTGLIIGLSYSSF